MRQPAMRTFLIPPIPAHVREVRDGVSELARAHVVDEEDLSHFQTAVGEALANAIEHAHSARPIEVDVRIWNDRIVATIRDHGIGFPAQLAGTASLPGGSAERGRGLPIMRRCSDIFAIHSVPGEGTLVVIGRFRSRHQTTGCVA